MEHFTADDPNEVINRLRTKLMVLDIGKQKLRSFKGLPVMTHAFFPGGNGLYKGVHATRFPIGGTLILGSNFGCLRGFIDAQGQLLITDERKNATWTPLLYALQAAEIKADECFFTNAWPFLHEGESNLGPIGDWLQDQILMAACVGFFEYTFKIMQPRLIIGLGIGPAALLSRVWPKDLVSWRRYALDGLDDLPMATVHLEGQRAVCVAITHPSMPNAWRRRPPYQNRTGEVQLLTEARLKSESISR